VDDDVLRPQAGDAVPAGRCRSVRQADFAPEQVDAGAAVGRRRGRAAD
jgi:hypothetical protein